MKHKIRNHFIINELRILKVESERVKQHNIDVFINTQK